MENVNPWESSNNNINYSVEKLLLELEKKLKSDKDYLNNILNEILMVMTD